jgi:uncharacterized protein YjbJ (UPF0337 family)
VNRSNPPPCSRCNLSSRISYKHGVIARDDRRKEKHVGTKRSSQDKGEGAMDKLKGRAKEATGAVTGDKAKKSEGRSDQNKGTAKDKLGKAKDLLK